MSYSFRLNPKQVNQLLQAAGKQLNTDPNQLLQEIQQGGAENLADSIGGEAGQTIRQILNDPQQLQAVLRSPDVQKLLNSLGEK